MSQYFDSTAPERMIRDGIAAGDRQRDIAQIYAMIIFNDAEANWTEINSAITERWPDKLGRVQEMARRMVDEHRSRS